MRYLLTPEKDALCLLHAQTRCLGVFGEGPLSQITVDSRRGNEWGGLRCTKDLLMPSNLQKVACYNSVSAVNRPDRKS